MHVSATICKWPKGKTIQSNRYITIRRKVLTSRKKDLRKLLYHVLLALLCSVLARSLENWATTTTTYQFSKCNIAQFGMKRYLWSTFKAYWNLMENHMKDCRNCIEDFRTFLKPFRTFIEPFITFLKPFWNLLEPLWNLS